MTTWLILSRAVHFGACLLFFGIFAFDRFTVAALASRQSEMGDHWKTRLRLFSLILLPLIFVSGFIWFVLIAMAMSGEPPRMEIMKIVWTQTQFGTVWKVRLILLLMAAVVVGLSYFLKSQKSLEKFAVWLQAALSGCLLGSLAWAGHGQESSPWHLFADILHLLGAGFWPAGLLPLFLFLQKSRKAGNQAGWLYMAALVRRFSAISLAAVSLLAVTGLVNSWFLVGSIPNLFGQPYGRWLLAKIIFFCAALAIASVNLLRLKPRLAVETSQPEKVAATVAQLQTNVQIELLLGLAIVFVVAILGILPPAIQ
jgi:copper resistance protein D